MNEGKIEKNRLKELNKVSKDNMFNLISDEKANKQVERINKKYDALNAKYNNTDNEVLER